MLNLDAIDVEEMANALADQHDYEHRWLIDPQTGEAFWIPGHEWRLEVLDQNGQLLFTLNFSATDA